MTRTERIDAAALTADFGRPQAAKTGHRPEWPYVPVIERTIPRGRQTEIIRGYAFATRDEALAFAAKHIEGLRAQLRRQLAEPRYRALRQAYGIPEEAN